MPLAVLLATAFVEGLCVLLIEILGARAMAPYFGSSLPVWTSQITATLLFLALGYRLGGRLSTRPSSWHLPLLFAQAGGWLLLTPLFRDPLMRSTGETLGIAAGSFASAAVLFGIPLLSLGAVSPVLIGAIDRSRPGAGSAAGSLFFTNTLGGLAGGWATAFAVIPHLSVSAALAGASALLLLLALFWTGARRNLAGAGLALAAGVLAVSLVVVWVRTRPKDEELHMRRVIFEGESSVGKIEVVDYGFAGQRSLLLDGTYQNQINVDTGRSMMSFSHYLDALAYHFAPGAKRALVIGLGAGVVPRALVGRGLEVHAVDVEPRMEEVARAYFGMPDSVEVEIADGRSVLRRAGDAYDIIILDVFAGENVPWHLATVETFRDIAARLTPGGRLVINFVTYGNGDSPGLARVEASLLQVFADVRVFVAAAADDDLANATIVAGRDLDAALSPTPGDPALASTLGFLLPRGRQGTARVAPMTDDWSDVDYADAALRARWRAMLLEPESGS